MSDALRAPLEALHERMMTFAKGKPSGQQVRVKSAREMVEVFADQLAALLSADTSPVLTDRLIVEAGDITVARKEVFGDWTSGVMGPTAEDYQIAAIINRRISSRSHSVTASEETK